MTVKKLAPSCSERKRDDLEEEGFDDDQPLTVGMLEEWAGAGAHWRVIHLGERRAVVELQQCTGEPVERLESDDPELLAYLNGVESDLDLC